MKTQCPECLYVGPIEMFFNKVSSVCSCPWCRLELRVEDGKLVPAMSDSELLLLQMSLMATRRPYDA